MKQLRYILQMAESPGASRNRGSETAWLDSLGKVKDQIGDWHDWCELEQIARGVLDKKDDGATLKQIAETVNNRFERAVATANKMRARYLSGGTEGRRGPEKRFRRQGGSEACRMKSGGEANRTDAADPEIRLSR